MKCPPGTILRKGYVKKAHTRKSYKRGSKKIRGSYVNKSYVSSTCIKDVGKIGKTPKNERTLPEVGSKKLGPFGYSTKKSEQTRRKSLRDASKYYGTLSVLRHLNLVRNYQSKGTKSHKIMTNDVEYMKKLYKKWKKKHIYKLKK